MNRRQQIRCAQAEDYGNGLELHLTFNLKSVKKKKTNEKTMMTIGANTGINRYYE